MSHKLWLSERFFPTIPFFKFIPKFPNPWDWFILLGLFTLLILGLIYRNRKVFIGIISITAILLLQDQMRWQPWAYIYLLLLLPFLWKEDQQKVFINYFQIILIGVYIWSGIHKLSPNFIEITFMNILKVFWENLDPETFQSISFLGYSISIIEIITGIFLILPKLRKIGVYLACMTHITILIYLSPLGINSNSIVYPWNIAMIIIVFLTFFGTNNKLFFWKIEKPAFSGLQCLVIILVWVLPGLNFAKLWDHYLSFSLYSGKVNVFHIAIQQGELGKIDRRYRDYFVDVEGLTGGAIIDVNLWAMKELNVPFYPETRLFKEVGKTFCKQNIAEENLVLIEYEMPMEQMKFQSYYCKDL